MMLLRKKSSLIVENFSEKKQPFDAIDDLEYDEYGRCCCCGLSSNLGHILWFALEQMIDAEVVTWFACFIVKQWTVTMALDSKIRSMILRIIVDGYVAPTGDILRYSAAWQQSAIVVNR